MASKIDTKTIKVEFGTTFDKSKSVPMKFVKQSWDWVTDESIWTLIGDCGKVMVHFSTNKLLASGMAKCKFKIVSTGTFGTGLIFAKVSLRKTYTQ